ncbi:MAG: hypothetical protein F6K22_28435 [Okeania sp. SIO2F4]|uniref:hypothetical protein n=1 Tax=Okeania sp. SIO2F4 TaxID=2607790 RepID=UPI00142C5496|nr:hypothetical protein [Okeania sp. SIO2F4]NES06399.1 hypothetical protein [Okeania sp. SIO2F4]
MNFFTTLLNFAATSLVGGVVSEEFGPDAGYIARKATGLLLHEVENPDISDDTYDFDLDLDLD